MNICYQNGLTAEETRRTQEGNADRCICALAVTLILIGIATETMHTGFFLASLLAVLWTVFEILLPQLREFVYLRRAARRKYRVYYTHYGRDHFLPTEYTLDKARALIRRRNADYGTTGKEWNLTIAD